jgi:Zn-dependent peptidase ImmA (M78 family)
VQDIGQLVGQTSTALDSVGCFFTTKDLTSPGRIRFTQAHELGHYILHRLECDHFECTDKDMLSSAPGIRNNEAESDLFASCLLMPLDDYRGS